jgi:putative Holliday junction resolvase
MQKGKVLALDYGKKRVGLATGDFEFGIAFPREVILNNGISDLIEKIVSFCDEFQVSLIVVGLPLNMDFEEIENDMVTEVRYFVSELRKQLNDDIEVRFLDERLSSFEAKELMNDAKSIGDKKSFGKDAYAAQIILQRFFDKNRA